MAELAHEIAEGVVQCMISDLHLAFFQRVDPEYLPVMTGKTATGRKNR